MNGNFPKILLALVIAVAVFAVLRLRELTPGRPRGQATESPSQTRRTPETQPSKVATGKRPEGKPTETPSEPKREPASTRSPAELFSELFRQGEWAVSRGRDGRLTGLKGTPIAGATIDARSALAFAKRLARQLGTDPEQLSDAHSQSDTEQGMQTVYKYEQWLGETPVFGASLSVFSRRADAAAFLVNSTLKPVDSAPPAGISRAQAESLVLSHYKDRGGRISTPIFSDEYIYADQVPVEFAWYFMVDVTGPSPKKLKVLFGATTKRVLYEAPAQIN